MAGLVLPRVISLIGFISILLAGIAYFIAWKDVDIKLSYISTGHGTKNDTNMKWFSGISIILCGILCAAIAIYEIILFINPIKFKFGQYQLFRALVYFYISITVLGVSGDLGISACAFCLLSTIINLVICFGIFCECIIIEKADASQYQKANDQQDDDSAKDSKA